MDSMAANMPRKPLAPIVDDDNASRLTVAAAMRKDGFETCRRIRERPGGSTPRF